MFVLNAYFCRELRFVAILRSTQIFTQKYRSWLRFYSEFLRKNWRLGALVIMTMSNYDQGQKGIVSYYILHLSADSAQENTRVEKRIDGKSLEIQSLFFYYSCCIRICRIAACLFIMWALGSAPVHQRIDDTALLGPMHKFTFETQSRSRKGLCRRVYC